MRSHVDPQLKRIYDEAALWLQRQDDGLTHDERRAYEQWLALPGRAEAMRRMEAHEEAALWMLRKQDGGLTPDERRAYAQWLEAPGNAEAIRSMEAFSARLDQPRPRYQLAAKFATCS